MDRDPDPPPMIDAWLDPDSLRMLFDDLSRFADLDDVIIKTGPGYVPQTSGATLDEARRLIESRAVRGVQFRYRHDGAKWLDTLMISQSGVRLVRIRSD